MRKLALALCCLAACRDPNAPNPEGPPGATPAAAQPATVTPQDAAARIDSAQLAAPPPTMHAVAAVAPGATFEGGALRYLGYEWLPAQPFPGGVMRLTHYWQVLKPIQGDWTVFVHLEMPGTPGVAVNGDHVPLGGLYPTSQWRAGTIFRDDELLRLPPQLTGKALDLYVGLFQGDVRMTLDQAPLGRENRLHAGQIPLGEGPNATLPVYQVRRTKGPIAIDGKLDEADWQRAPWTPSFVRSLDGGKTKYDTKAKLLWDDQNLYVAFRCEDPDVWAHLTKHDDPLYDQDDVVELFVDADGDGKTYNELEISPANVTFDADFKERRKDLEKAMTWDSGMRTAVVIDGTLNQGNDQDRGWTVEAAVPIAKLDAVPHVPPKPGDRWRANLYRLDRSTGGRTNEGSAWSPLFVGDFHALSRFGWLEFEN